MTTLPTLSPAERDALYYGILIRLTGINDVYGAIERGDFVAADRLSGEFSALLRVVQDLGWGNEGTEVVLTAPPDVVKRALGVLKERAENEDREEAEERKELAARAEGNRILREACARQIAALEGGKKRD
jgi:hypothetical protein